jgi:hypothetical protein
MPDTVIVTGCEKNYFLMACTLLHTLKRWCPDVPVYVLDFGLDVAQKRFLADRAIVLDRPSDLPPHLDPFLYKAAIAKYLRPIDWSTIVWLDCDMIAVGPIRQRLNEVVTEMERNSIEVAACLDISETIGAFLAGGYKAEPFVAAIRKQDISPSSRYFNVGIVICRSHEFVDAWTALAGRIADHVNFDQNLFNLVVHARKHSILTLPRHEWNVHGSMLASIRAASDPIYGTKLKTNDHEQAVLILHPTSSRKEDIVQMGAAEIGTHRVPGHLFFCRTPAAFNVQRTVLSDFLTQSIGELRSSGLTLPAT